MFKRLRELKPLAYNSKEGSVVPGRYSSKTTGGSTICLFVSEGKSVGR